MENQCSLGALIFKHIWVLRIIYNSDTSRALGIKVNAKILIESNCKYVPSIMDLIYIETEKIS